MGPVSMRPSRDCTNGKTESALHLGNEQDERPCSIRSTLTAGSVGGLAGVQLRSSVGGSWAREGRDLQQREDQQGKAYRYGYSRTEGDVHCRRICRSAGTVRAGRRFCG